MQVSGLGKFKLKKALKKAVSVTTGGAATRLLVKPLARKKRRPVAAAVASRISTPVSPRPSVKVSPRAPLRSGVGSRLMFGARSRNRRVAIGKAKSQAVRQASAARAVVAAQSVPEAFRASEPFEVPASALIPPRVQHQWKQQPSEEREQEQGERDYEKRMARTVVAAQSVPDIFVPPVNDGGDAGPFDDTPEAMGPLDDPYAAMFEGGGGDEDEEEEGPGLGKWSFKKNVIKQAKKGFNVGKQAKKNLRKVAMVAGAAAAVYYAAPLVAKALTGAKGAAGAALASGQSGVLSNPAYLKTAAGLIKNKMASAGTPVTDAQALAIAEQESARSQQAIEQGRSPAAADGPPSWLKFMPIILPVFALAIAAMKA